MGRKRGSIYMRTIYVIVLWSSLKNASLHFLLSSLPSLSSSSHSLQATQLKLDYHLFQSFISMSAKFALCTVLNSKNISILKLVLSLRSFNPHSHYATLFLPVSFPQFPSYAAESWLNSKHISILNLVSRSISSSISSRRGVNCLKSLAFLTFQLHILTSYWPLCPLCPPLIPSSFPLFGYHLC